MLLHSGKADAALGPPPVCMSALHSTHHARHQCLRQTVHEHMHSQQHQCLRCLCSVRVRGVFKRYLEGKPWGLAQVELFRERFEGPFDGGRQLPMSCGAERGLSAEARADEAQVAQAFEEARWGRVGLLCVRCVCELVLARRWRMDCRQIACAKGLCA